MLIRILSLILLVSLSGCSVVHVYDEQGKAKVRQGIGIVYVEIPDDAGKYLISNKGVGIAKINNSINIGYFDSKEVILNDKCAAIFWVENRQQLMEAKELLKSIPDLCVYSVD